MNGLLNYTVNVKGRLLDLSKPQVMGILNVTPDSFYAGSRKQTEKEIALRANQIIEEGGAFFDRNAPPEHLSHIVLIGGFPGWGNREVLETGGA